ncbi:MAG: HAD family phosphatase [Anaerolineales bacterium]|nr:HAD family phosphatase [Anaerolineales bacterium]
MIRAMIFDLDGTLVQTEKLKAISYAKAVIDLCPQTIGEDEVIEAFKEVVGLSRREVAAALVDRFDLEAPAQARMQEFGVDSPWQAFVQIRLDHYGDMLADPDLLLNNQWPHNRAVLDAAREEGCRTGLATMSRCEQAQRVLEILGMKDDFDFVATRDDVEIGKPDPEIYQLVSSELDVPAEDCLVLEDSPSGVRAALAAGMWCIAVTTPFTREQMHALDILEERWIVDDPEQVTAVVQKMIAEHKGSFVD